MRQVTERNGIAGELRPAMQKKARPILFRGAMVRAILDGRKTQTRRVLKPQPEWRKNYFHWFAKDRQYCWNRNGVLVKGVSLANDCPYGQPGERLWVKETHQWCPECGNVDYAADVNRPKNCRSCDASLGNWRPSIFMFQCDSRLTLEVVRVRVERLQDISEEDAKAEGAQIPFVNVEQSAGSKFQIGDPLGLYRDHFRVIWDNINGGRDKQWTPQGPLRWDVNPWVWVIEFKRVVEQGR